MLNAALNVKVRPIPALGFDRVLCQDELALRRRHERAVLRLQTKRNEHDSNNAGQHETGVGAEHQRTKCNADFSGQNDQHPIALSWLVVVVHFVKAHTNVVCSLVRGFRIARIHGA